MLLKVTLSEEELTALDATRGQTPRATWVRELVRECTANKAAAREVRAAAADFEVVTDERMPADAVLITHKEGCRCLTCERARGRVT